jgi:hypothetical protein
MLFSISLASQNRCIEMTFVIGYRDEVQRLHNHDQLACSRLVVTSESSHRSHDVLLCSTIILNRVHKGHLPSGTHFGEMAEPWATVVWIVPSPGELRGLRGTAVACPRHTQSEWPSVGYGVGSCKSERHCSAEVIMAFWKSNSFLAIVVDIDAGGRVRRQQRQWDARNCSHGASNSEIRRWK